MWRKAMWSSYFLLNFHYINFTVTLSRIGISEIWKRKRTSDNLNRFKGPKWPMYAIFKGFAVLQKKKFTPWDLSFTGFHNSCTFVVLLKSCVEPLEIKYFLKTSEVRKKELFHTLPHRMDTSETIRKTIYNKSCAHRKLNDVHRSAY